MAKEQQFLGNIGRRRLLQGSAAASSLLTLAACTGSATDSQRVSGLKQTLATGLRSQQAMAALTNTITRISRSYFSAQRGITDPADIAEGQRYLMHLLSAGIDFYLEGNPQRPWFINMVSPVRKFLGDNPDARYFFAPIDGEQYYRISGTRQADEYISYTVHTGGHDGNWNGPGISHINHTELEFDSDGHYEIILGPKQRGRNWLETGPKAFYVVNRHYYEHKRSAAGNPLIEPQLHIEPAAPGPLPAQQLSDEETASRLNYIGNFLRVSTIDQPVPNPDSVPVWWSLVPNQMGQVVNFGENQDDIGLGAIDNTYTAGPYSLQPGQCLLMEGHLPQCFFANVVLWNRYLQTDNYLYRQVSLNRKQMKLRRGGGYRIVVAPENPGVNNWLDTAGRSNGIIQWRFLLARNEVERPRCRVVSIAEAAALAD